MTCSFSEENCGYSAGYTRTKTYKVTIIWSSFGTRGYFGPRRHYSEVNDPYHRLRNHEFLKKFEFKWFSFSFSKLETEDSA